jgi:hypothetical protein
MARAMLVLLRGQLQGGQVCNSWPILQTTKGYLPGEGLFFWVLFGNGWIACGVPVGQIVGLPAGGSLLVLYKVIHGRWPRAQKKKKTESFQELLTSIRPEGGMCNVFPPFKMQRGCTYMGADPLTALLPSCQNLPYKTPLFLFVALSGLSPQGRIPWWDGDEGTYWETQPNA